MATSNNKARHGLILLLIFQAFITTLYGQQQFESDVLGQKGNVSADANYDAIKQLCNLLHTVELLREAEPSINHQMVIEVGEALKSTMQNWFDGLSDIEQSGIEGEDNVDQLGALCVRATAAVKATRPE